MSAVAPRRCILCGTPPGDRQVFFFVPHAPQAWGAGKGVALPYVLCRACKALPRSVAAELVEREFMRRRAERALSN